MLTVMRSDHCAPDVVSMNGLMAVAAPRALEARLPRRGLREGPGVGQGAGNAHLRARRGVAAGLFNGF